MARIFFSVRIPSEYSSRWRVLPLKKVMSLTGRVCPSCRSRKKFLRSLRAAQAGAKDEGTAVTGPGDSNNQGNETH